MPSKTKQSTAALRPMTKSEKLQMKGKQGSAPSPVKTLSNIYKGAKRLYNKVHGAAHTSKYKPE
tara:strand:- start:2140 stop:2331 length:192 start_codon:yes stop_codon:yes gene_type:complete